MEEYRSDSGRVVVILVENLPVPLDRHVWQQACALRDAGWRVHVICPRTDRFPVAHEIIDSIEVHRHAMPAEGKGIFGLLSEYTVALYHELRLLSVIRMQMRIDVIHACNPPDLLFLVAAPFKLLGARFVYDQHDLVPELFAVRFGNKGFLRRLLSMLVGMSERLSYASADFVLASNDSFRDLALQRGRVAHDRITTVYTIPEPGKLGPPIVRAVGQKARTLGYLGIIGDQDGLDHLVDAVHILRDKYGRQDFEAIVIGDGPALPAARARAQQRGVADLIGFTGFLSGDPLRKRLATIDIGIIPDPVNEFNHLIPMNKVFEYSALGIPSVAYPLRETMRLLEDTGTYAEGEDPEALARAIMKLLNDTQAFHDKAAAALELARRKFDWRLEAQKLVKAYDRLEEEMGAG